ncbi:MAG TPA: methylated-DNA--[protein]-cysteine S-methyltransferase [Casimicrobiaceae bacterium]|nr:methylated-DNA--[protein]-cysteine S-methyltransferase [Casimicrobiaceae bacterium]
MRTSEYLQGRALNVAAAVDRYTAAIRAPFAVLGIRSDGSAITHVAYLPDDEPEQAPHDRIAARALREIERYLDDPAFHFTVPLRPLGTAFQRRVWEAISAIPLAESRTYGEIARSVRSGARAVGQACGANRIALIIPCHRVVASGGSLGGFMSTAGPSQGANSTSWGAAQRPNWPMSPQGWGGHTPADRGDPLAIKRWLLAHEGYRFGA